MRGRTFRALIFRRPADGFVRGLSNNRTKATSYRLSARKIPFTGVWWLRHELKTPLSGILGMAELLRESGLAGEQRKFLLALQESGRQMERLIEKMDASRVGTSELEPINGMQLLEQVIRAHWPAALKQGIGLYLLFDHRLPEKWHSDTAGLRQLLDNLLANAIKFTHHGYVLLDARLAGGNQAGKLDVELRVCDTGIGIASCDSRRIYSKFEQGNDDIRQRYGGSGLGLFVCDRIAAALGGSVQHRPNARGGTCFKVVLPGIADAVPNNIRRLRPALLAGLRCQLRLRRPISGVVTEWLQRMGVQVGFDPIDEYHRLPGSCDFVICDSSKLGSSIHGTPAASVRSRPVLLSNPSLPAAAADGDEHGSTMFELPEPLLYSNLEPLLLQLAIRRVMTLPGSGRHVQE